RKDASQALIAKVLAKRTFQKQVVLPRTKELDAPIALERDVELLAGSPLALEFLLRATRTASNRAFSVAQLTGKASSKFKKPFKSAVERQIEEGTLPDTIGWITISRVKKLFLWEDVHRGVKPAGIVGEAAKAATRFLGDGKPTMDQAATVPTRPDFAQAFD